ncbi:hypothetical protein PT974_11959 [Cladobotryum mycophilum]|uniref:Uncharacterized protein n=1 Tax=Cladobotryum mycophilum TaxID=491253 RepID=A0ABR0S7R7_9HYPO
MQTVPSLIGTGTAIAAAASGLVFGQPAEPSTSSTTIRQSQPRRKISFDRDLPISARLNSLPPSRAGTTSETPSTLPEGPQNDTLSTQTPTSRPPLSRYQRPSTTSKGLGRKLSLVKRQGSGSTTAERRDSVSSNGSWIRRFAIRPLSQHGSSKSSVALETPSVTYSHSSTAPILPRPQTSSQPLARNKLVKRSPSVQTKEPTAPSHTRSKSHLPTLRRPATSHQRSATLQQQFRTDLDLANPSSSPTTSFDQPTREEVLIDATIGAQPRRSSKSSGWISFFHSRRLTIGGGGVASRFSEASPRSRSVSGKRISVVGDEGRRVHLVKPRMVSTSSAPAVLAFSADLREEKSKQVDLEQSASEVPPSRRSKRSFSMPFSSTGNWMSRSSSSLRRANRGAVGTGAETEGGEMGNHKRHVSAPISGAQIPVDQDSIAIAPAQLTIHPNVPAKQGPTNTAATVDSAANVQPPSHKRNLSSPLPPLPRNSSFHVDLPRIGSPSGATANHLIRPHQPSGSSTSSAAMSQLRASPHYERSSVMSSSESDTRGFYSGDDDDTDYNKSDTMHDSLRTAASSRMRAVETPLDSVYDESPPSTAGNGRTKRLSIQEMLGGIWDDDKIMEEDENDATPVRVSDDAEADYTTHPTLEPSRLVARSSHDTVLVSTKSFGGLSLDDDLDEEDWDVEDQDMHFNALSPPPRIVRLALATGSGNEMLEPHGHETRGDRPLSTVFDWIEPSVPDKNDAEGNSSRPKTASGKQEVDARGGRAASRKGPAPAHIRSQSVPVLHDAPENVKLSSAKYGTWGLGSKPVSEDWDEDFEFGCGTDNGGVGNGTLFSVPESIRASQPSVKAHSGQIRELSLLVNDLKRLCRHGRDMDMLEGPQKGLWKEAEGVIALASPDEEEDSVDESQETISINFDAVESNDQLFDDGFDAASLGRLDAAFETLEPPMSRTAVVRERHSPKRRSVFSAEDDIFGGHWPLVEDHCTPSNRSSRPRTPHIPPPNDVTGVTRSVMEAMHRSIPNQTHEVRYDKKVHFDTNSLRFLVRRAGELRDSLSDVVRKAEHLTQSPSRTPRHERNPDSSPAFTRVFDDPNASPQRRLIRSRGNNSLLDGTSTPNSPPSPMGRRLQPMTVS